jgi:hypothetical protein
MSLSAPKQCKLLGATVRGLGVITDVSSYLNSASFVVVWAGRMWDKIALRDLRRAAFTRYFSRHFLL